MAQSLTLRILYTEDSDKVKEHKKLINFIKAVLIIVTAAAILCGLSRILLLKSEDGINQFQAFYKQPENSIDVIFSGSSKVYCDIATGVLWENYGIAAFDLAGAEAPSWVTYYQLKEALRTQKPKVFCYEVSVTAMFSQLTQANNWATDNSYGMKWNSNRIDQLRVNSTEDEFLMRLNPFNIMHGRYKDLSENDFTNVRDSVNYKGFDPRENIHELDTPDTINITDSEPCSDKEIEYMKKLIDLTREEGIEMVMFVSPYDVSEKEMRILNYVEEFARSEGVEYIDFNKRYDDIGMDFSRDMADTGHLGYTGNYKFTDYFGSILKEKYDLPDHRGDDRYQSWEWDAALQDYERNDLRIVQSEDAAQILNMVQKGYVVFVTNDDRASIFYDGEFVENGEGDYRLTYKVGEDSFLFTRDRVNNLYRLFINDDEYTGKHLNVVIVYDAVLRRYVKAIYY